MSSPGDVHVAPASPEHESGLTGLYERTGSPCHCRYWHFEGGSNDWLERCSQARSTNERELRRAVASRSDEARGMVALSKGVVVGWMKLSPASTVKKLYGQRLYRNLECFDGDRTGVFVVGCFLVDEDFRRRGVAEALLTGGIEAARVWGARSIEAFPRNGDVPAEQLWTGPTSIFERAGFETVHDFRPYPVLRKHL